MLDTDLFFGTHVSVNNFLIHLCMKAFNLLSYVNAFKNTTVYLYLLLFIDKQTFSLLNLIGYILLLIFNAL